MKIVFNSIEELNRALARINGPEFAKPMQDIAHALSVEARRIFQQYPGPSHQPVIWASEKQRRWYFAMRRSKGLPLQYSRDTDQMSDRIGQKWVTKYEPKGALVGTRVGYAAWVHSAKDQQPQHRATGWKTDEMVVKELETSNVIKKVIEKELKAFFEAPSGRRAHIASTYR